MRSPASGRPRLIAEWALRSAALLLLVLALWRETRPAAGGDVVRLASDDRIVAALASWSADPDVRVAHVMLAAPPADTIREWIAALRAAGVQVTYELPPLPATALAAEAVADPLRPVRLLAAAPSGERIVLGDDAGLLDTVTAAGGGVRLVTASAAAPVAARAGAAVARTAPTDSLLLRPVLVLGRAGWEARFTIAALEERGWPVIARLAVAPGVTVSQGALPAIDTAGLSAVVVLDSTASTYAGRVAAYVRQGGGLILSGEGAALPAYASLAPGRAGSFQPPSTEALSSDDPRRGLPLRALTPSSPEAIAIERRGALVTVLVRRVGGGRVAQLGYHESWRWRLAGPDGSPEQHRDWWAGLLAAVAHAPPVVVGSPAPALDDAPVARLVAALGPSRGAPGLTAVDALPPPDRAPLLFALIAAALLAEWAARRLRGAP